MGHHFCPNSNRNCTPSNLCTPCNGGGVLKDGEGISVPMMMRDSMHQAAQRVIRESRVTVTDDVRAQARRDHEAWQRQGQPIQHDGLSDYHAAALAVNARSNAATLAQAAERNTQVQAARDRHNNASDVAYAAMCADLQNGRRA